MKKVKIYLVIRDEESNEEVSIKGNLEILIAVIKSIINDENIDFSRMAQD